MVVDDEWKMVKAAISVPVFAYLIGTISMLHQWKRERVRITNDFGRITMYPSKCQTMIGTHNNNSNNNDERKSTIDAENYANGSFPFLNMDIGGFYKKLH